MVLVDKWYIPKSNTPNNVFEAIRYIAAIISYNLPVKTKRSTED